MLADDVIEREIDARELDARCFYGATRRHEHKSRNDAATGATAR